MEHNTHSSSSSPGTLEGPAALLSSAWNLFTKHWQFLVPLFLWPSLLIYVGNILKMTGDSTLGILSLVCMVAGVILSVAQRAAAIHAIKEYSHHSDKILTLKGEYRLGFTFFWPIVWVTILAGLMFFGSFVLFVIPAVIFSIYTMFYTFFVVLEGKRGVDSFVQSFLLVRGRWVDVLGRLLFLALATLGAYLVLAGIVFLLRSIFDFGPDTLGGDALAMLFNLALSAIIGPVSVAYLYNLYAALKKHPVHTPVPHSLSRWLVAFVIVGLLAVISVPVLVAFLMTLPQ